MSEEEKTEKKDKAERPERTRQTERAGRTDRMEPAERPRSEEQAEQPEKPKKKELKRWQKIRRARIIALCITMALLLALVVLLFFLGMSGYLGGVIPAQPVDTEICLKREEPGWQMSWTPGENASAYLVEVYPGENVSGTPVFGRVCTEAECILPADLPENARITLRITPKKYYDLFDWRLREVDGESFSLSSCLREADRYVPEWRVDAERRTLTVGCSGGSSDIYHLYMVRSGDFLEEVSEMHYTSIHNKDRGYGEMVVSFGDDRDFPLPADGEQYTFLLRAERVEEHLRIWEELNDLMSVRRTDLLSNRLVVDQVALGDNRYRLSWSEAAGKGYRVQRLDDETGIWETIAEYETSDERIYETEHLLSGREYRYRVMSINDGSTVGAQSELSVSSGWSAVFATVWASKEIPLYSAADGGSEIGRVGAGTALCVTAEQGDRFRVYRPDGDAFVDSRDCLINLTDYLGELCDYDITNSYFSIYMAHDYELRGITGTICPGYENVLQADGTFLVPLLYPVAKRLALAADRTHADGYRLKIYDSFRPYVTTKFIFENTEAQLDTQAPAEPMQRMLPEEYLSLREQGLTAGLTGTALTALLASPTPEPILIPDAEGNPHYYNLDGTEYFPPDPLEEEPLSPFTYRQLMTTDSFGLNYFLAKGYSRHNYGVAVDLTLERRDTGEELQMQTAMHDLSYHSSQSSNNGEAKLLQDYMYGVGFAGLVSEWWHFQDDEVMEAQKPSVVVNGLSSEGWKVDDHGVRYCRPDGSFVRDGILSIDGADRHFGADGYLVE
ncbi:MAG: hypothetical protein K6E50_03215 [Lachnospiraceae bacterium]|nr:hypothetical protein [Lachnospiraceae bacterium]